MKFWSGISSVMLPTSNGSNGHIFTNAVAVVSAVIDFFNYHCCGFDKFENELC